MPRLPSQRADRSLMSTRFDRRTFLQAAGRLALFAGLAPAARVWASAPFPAYPFLLGVASGDPVPDGFVIWTRLAPRPLDEHAGMPMVAVPVRWEVAEDEGFATVVRRGEAIARPELGHSIHVEVQGLRPRRPYWYRFHVTGQPPSPVGTVRTAPAAADSPERVCAARRTTTASPTATARRRPTTPGASTEASPTATRSWCARR